MSNLSFLNGWVNAGRYITHRSAQSFMGVNRPAFTGSSCGAGDDKPQPSACGADDDSLPQPSACGSSCGAGDSK
jgi:ACGX-repeat protein